MSREQPSRWHLGYILQRQTIKQKETKFNQVQLSEVKQEVLFIYLFFLQVGQSIKQEKLKHLLVEI